MEILVVVRQQQSCIIMVKFVVALQKINEATVKRISYKEKNHFPFKQKKILH